MANTIERLQEYLDALKSVVGKDQVSQEYQQFYTALSTLSETMSSQEHINADTKALLEKQYLTLIQSSEKFLSKESPSGFEKRIGSLVTEVRTLCMRDLDVISRIDPQLDLPVTELIKEARKDILDITGGADRTRVGNYMSSRIPIMYADRSGRMVKGFFTEGTTLKDVNTMVGEAFGKLISSHPEYAPFLERLQHTKDFINSLDEFENLYPEIVDSENIDTQNIAEDAMSRLIQSVIDPNGNLEYLESSDEYKELFGEKPIWDIVKDFSPFAKGIFAIAPVTAGYLGDESCKASVGSSIEERNCAMTGIANLLGESSLVAESHNVTVYDGHKQIHGSFMKMAPGSDADHPYKNDPLVEWAETHQSRLVEDFDITKDAVKQMMDLQILDYICGNVDRHPGNMLYQVDEQGNICGITGIDNDLSFGSVHNGPNKVDFKNLGCISESMAEKVMALTPDMLKFTLSGYNLSADEKNAVYARLKELQTAISAEYLAREKGIEPEGDRLYILRDEEISFARVLNPGAEYNYQANNLFSNMAHVPTKVLKAKADLEAKGGLPEKNSLSFMGAVTGITTATPKEQFKLMADNVSSLYEMLKADRAMHVNSGRYNKLKEATEKVLASLNTAASSDIEPEAYAKLNTELETLKTLAADYVSDKPAIPKTEMGQKRIAAARELRDYAQTIQDDITSLHIHEGDERIKTFAESQLEKVDSALGKAPDYLKAAGSLEAKWDIIAKIIAASTARSEFAKNPNSKTLELLTQQKIQNGAVEIQKSDAFTWLKQSGKDPLSYISAGPDFVKAISDDFTQAIIEAKNPSHQMQSSKEVSGPGKENTVISGLH